MLSPLCLTCQIHFPYIGQWIQVTCHVGSVEKKTFNGEEDEQIQISRDLKARISHRQDGERKWAGFVNLQTLVMIIS
jgi:hypothetical protein